MSEVNVTFVLTQKGERIEATVSADQSASQIIENLRLNGLIPDSPGTAIVWNGTQLQANQTLEQLGVVDEDEIQVFLHTRGGGYPKNMERNHRRLINTVVDQAGPSIAVRLIADRLRQYTADKPTDPKILINILEECANRLFFEMERQNREADIEQQFKAR